MRNRTLTATSAAVLAALCAAPASGAAPQTLPTEQHKVLHAIGLTGDQRLVEFDVNKPARTWSLGKVSGLSGETKLVRIDCPSSSWPADRAPTPRPRAGPHSSAAPVPQPTARPPANHRAASR